ncbi:bifunctional (p)ppGpp synthetase/guanosine-3',5'-bis(diphosphate) 3'-pyrophosphohydrolase [Komagataeibacter sp. AV436]|uniref:GTP pyrophosphokinase rsh n=1 Tax=Komagataeibacter melomenusus TaxID=2766578 RepID=A0ABX2AHZ2_9PROT|nr:bifunctional (p)ppGpp synthetase/guanosine-3',5'-bis(diphosphate) 3'-pyrophosphohydrolase [Komagataeibacter melomenusus]MBV1831725.1 bifunctional (p)ppGpp synthetase/guanosine-3',5'-bis(diphosphate) 3'-pyrophosphohydrolase [Komagataeibacter melomenusus]NPC67400.1 bifunctional (p)ppGpp synthetase/guanosine-3',5'-bis(diphosphate) 3'-pyrophosphohydrolase [Komagataeibacter melomenusus]
MPVPVAGGVAASAATLPARHEGGERTLSCEGLIRRIQAYDPAADADLIRRAFAVAAAAHAGQARDNGDPYITHPLAVANILAGFHLDTASIVTALLHDTVEDTGVTQKQLREQFGDTVAELVDGVTKLTRLELQSDRTKQAENFRKLVLAMSRDIRVLLVKLADRLHNMRTLHYVQRIDRRQRIARETMEIYAPLAGRIGMDKVKVELQNLSFAALEPEAMATIRARLNYLRGQGADVIEEIRRELQALCIDAGLEGVEVTGREKTPYSIWEKMQRRNVAFEQLSDIMAFRIIVPSREACYIALGAVHAAYPVIAGRFKDYISTPKANGYQSLHTGVTLRHPRNQKIEVQIRTAEMHDVAENGVASHWLYKQLPDAAAKGATGGVVSGLRWVQDLLDILEDSSAPDEFLENTKLELYQDQVFCFTPKGQLISLPRGATPVDFAYAVHSQVGDTCVGARINGRLMPLRHELQNGDQVEIMTARGGTPSPSWERFVATGKARARIRRHVALQQREAHLESGRVALAKAFRQEGVDGSEKVLESLLKDLRLQSVADLYVAVGNGNQSAREVVQLAYPELRRAPRAPRMVPGLSMRAPAGGALGGGIPGRRRPAAGGMALAGVGAGMAVHFAGCCHPLPGDRIVGIVSTGKGITVHTLGCQTLETFAATPERFMDLDWDYDLIARNATGHHTGRLSVVTANEPAMLATLTNIAAKHEGVMMNLRIVNRQLEFMEILADIEVRDLRHLTAIMVALRAAKGVVQVERARG